MEKVHLSNTYKIDCKDMRTDVGSWGREREERINEETVDGASTTGAGKKTQESQRRAWRQ